MIFVFPAAVSKNVDQRLVPAVTKALEIYFVTMIAESITSGQLRIACYYDRKTRRYGALVAEGTSALSSPDENLKNPTYLKENEEVFKKMEDNLMAVLFEQSPVTLNNLRQRINRLEDNISKYRKQEDSLRNQSRVAQSEVDDYNRQIESLRIERSHLDVNRPHDVQRSSEIDSEILKLEIERDKRDADRIDRERQADETGRQADVLEREREELDREFDRLNDAVSRHETRTANEEKKRSEVEKHDLDQQRLTLQKNEDERKKREEDKEEESAATEKERRNSKKPTGSYQAAPMTQVDLTPTQVQLKGVDIRYVGGPKVKIVYTDTGERQREYTTTDDEHGLENYEKSELNIGAKIVPFIAKNYDNFIHVLMSDYYTYFIMGLLKAMWRNLARAFVGGLRWILKKIPKWLGGEVLEKITDPYDPTLWRTIILNKKGLMDGSTFSAKRGRAKFYHFSAAIAIVDVSDFHEDDRENFLIRSEKLRQLFRLGWNSFIFTDNTNQVAYFVSFIEGGAVYTLPYSYLFSTLKMDKVYENMDLLRSKAKPFSVRTGSFRNLYKKVVRESRVNSYIDDKLDSFSDNSIKKSKAEEYVNNKINKFSG